MKKNKKLVIGGLLVLFLTYGSLTATFADSSISGILSTWLDDRTEASIDEIDKAVQNEQVIQTERLKEALTASIEQKEKEWDSFVKEEKKNRVQAIQEYADKLMKEMELDETTEDPQLQKDLDRILEEAILEMEQLKSKHQKVEVTEEVVEENAE